MTIEGFEETSFSYQGESRSVYRRGEGPGVLIMHEIPGIIPEVSHFARLVADEGFSVAMPHLFGIPGKKFSVPYAIDQIFRACIQKEFTALALRKSSPITDWLRALCRHLYEEVGGKGVGALGMCFTGNFALSLMVDPIVMAPVLSQPSLPLFPIGKSRKEDLHVTDEELATIKKRVSEENIKVLGLRFTHDPMCPGERFSRLRKELGNGFEGIEIDSSPNNAFRIPRTAHSVLTRDLVDQEGHPTKEALTRVLRFFRETLL